MSTNRARVHPTPAGRADPGSRGDRPLQNTLEKSRAASDDRGVGTYKWRECVPIRSTTYTTVRVKHNNMLSHINRDDLFIFIFIFFFIKLETSSRESLAY